MRNERTVAGIRCGEVLAELSDFLDGQLAGERVRQIESHLRGCDVCERFGQRFSTVAQAVRRSLGPAPELEEPLARRLRQRLRRELD